MGHVSPSPASSSGLRPHSRSQMPKQAHGSRAGAGSELPTLAARTCSGFGVTRTLKCAGTVKCYLTAWSSHTTQLHFQRWKWVACSKWLLGMVVDGTAVLFPVFWEGAARPPQSNASGVPWCTLPRYHSCHRLIHWESCGLRFSAVEVHY